LGRCPGTKTSGGKLLSGKDQPVANRAAAALRMAAFTLLRSKSARGARFRRQRSRLDAPDKAITATARKRARLVCRMRQHGTADVDEGQKEALGRALSEPGRTTLETKSERIGLRTVETAEN
jgi:hypothetical protein